MSSLQLCKSTDLKIFTLVICINFSPNHTTKEKQRTLLGMATQTETQNKRDADLRIKKKKFSKVPYKLVNEAYIISHSLT